MNKTCYAMPCYAIVCYARLCPRKNTPKDNAGLTNNDKFMCPHLHLGSTRKIKDGIKLAGKWGPEFRNYSPYFHQWIEELICQELS